MEAVRLLYLFAGNGWLKLADQEFYSFDFHVDSLPAEIEFSSGQNK